MAQDFQVNYRINVDATAALQSIQAFEQATAKMQSLVTRIDTVTKSIGRLNSAMATIQKQPINIRFKTANAEIALRRVLLLLTQIKNNSQSTLTFGGQGAIKNLSFQKLQTTITNINKGVSTLNSTPLNVKANVSTAIRNLDILLGKIKQVKTNGKLTVVASATGATSGSNTVLMGAGGKKVSTPAPAAKAVPKAGHSQLLYPSTRQVLGPTYANTGVNVAGEMVKGMGVAYGLSALFSGIGSVFKDATAYNNISQTTRNILETHDKLPNFNARFNEANSLMRQVGVDTKFTAPQVAEAGKYLAMAGLNVDQIKQSIRPITDVALIGDTDLGETADVLTNIMTAYDIPANRMGAASDVLTMTFTKTNTTLMELAESFKYAGTIAKESGVSFETASAAFGVLGNAGIKASQAGTTIRMMINNMLNPTKKQQAAWEKAGVSVKDKFGNLRDLTDILLDLNKIKGTMSSGDFASLISQMFRITATPGALALVSNAQQVRDVVDLNYSSMGLASHLAGEKKNTVQGLWYQMTSSFTESGMKGFEQMQGTIKSFLIDLTKLMKSEGFAKALKDGMTMLLEMGKFFAQILQSISNVFNAIPSWVKSAVLWTIKLQMGLRTIAGTGQMLMSMGLLLRGIFNSPVIVNTLKWIGMGGNSIKYIFQLYNLLRLNAANPITSFGKAVYYGVTGRGGLLRQGAGVALSSVTNTVAGGTAGVAGAAAGGAAATQLTTWPLLKSFGSTVISHPFISAGIVGAMGLAALIYKLQSFNSLVTEAVKNNKAWQESLRVLGVDKMNVTSQDDVMIGNMRIFNNVLLDHNEKMEEAASLWKRYWEAKNGNKQPEKDNTKLSEGAKAEWWKAKAAQASMWFNKDITNAYYHVAMGLLEQNYATVKETVGEHEGLSYKQTYIDALGERIPLYNGGLNTASAMKLAFVEAGADHNNSKLIALEKHLATALSSAYNFQDFERIKKYAEQKFFPVIPTSDDLPYHDPSRLMEYSEEEVYSKSILYNKYLLHNMQKAISRWDDYGNILSSIEKGTAVSPDQIQKVLYARYAGIFNPQYGLVGSDEWSSRMKEIVKHPEFLKLESIEQVAHKIIEDFNNLNQWYNNLSPLAKPLFAPFINRGAYENILPEGYTLPEGGITSGKNINSDTITVNGVKYTWKVNPPYSTPNWINDKGEVLTSMEGASANNWTPNPNNNVTTSLHNGQDQSVYNSNKFGPTPKQVVVRIENLLRIDNQTIDMTDDKQVSAVENIKHELASALLDVVQDFNANI